MIHFTDWCWKITIQEKRETMVEPIQITYNTPKGISVRNHASHNFSKIHSKKIALHRIYILIIT